MATVLLLVGDAGPDPAAILRQAGWRAIKLPRLFRSPWMGAFPPMLPPGRPWPLDPFLVLPLDITSLSAQPPSLTPPLDREQVELLTAICQAIQQGYSICSNASLPAIGPDDPPAYLKSQPDVQIVSPWPAGPGSGRSAMSSEALATLVTRILSDIHTTDEGDPGLTRRRLAALLPACYKEHAQLLLTWFDRAGLLDAPRDPGQPWRYARCLIVRDLDEIAARLRLLLTQEQEIRA